LVLAGVFLAYHLALVKNARILTPAILKNIGGNRSDQIPADLHSTLFLA
jgi:hypothetical protein